MGSENGVMTGGNLGEQITHGIALAPIAGDSGDLYGVVIDRQYYNAVDFCVMTGLKDASTLTSVNAHIQEGDLANGNDMADIATDSLLSWGSKAMTAITAESSSSRVKAGLAKPLLKRYIRLHVVLVASGGNAKCQLAAGYVLSAPVKDQPL